MASSLRTVVGIGDEVCTGDDVRSDRDLALVDCRAVAAVRTTTDNGAPSNVRGLGAATPVRRGLGVVGRVVTSASPMHTNALDVRSARRLRRRPMRVRADVCDVGEVAP